MNWKINQLGSTVEQQQVLDPTEEQKDGAILAPIEIITIRQELDLA